MNFRHFFLLPAVLLITGCDPLKDPLGIGNMMMSIQQTAVARNAPNVTPTPVSSVTTVYSDNFESNSTAGWQSSYNSGAYAFNYVVSYLSGATTPVGFNPQYYLALNAITASPGSLIYTPLTINTSKDITFDYYVSNRFPATYNAEMSYAFQEGTQEISAVYINYVSGGPVQLLARNGASWVILENYLALPVNCSSCWYHLRMVYHPSTGLTDYNADGVQFTGFNSVTTGSTYVNQTAVFGVEVVSEPCCTTSQYAETYIDDITITQ